LCNPIPFIRVSDCTEVEVGVTRHDKVSEMRPQFALDIQPIGGIVHIFRPNSMNSNIVCRKGNLRINQRTPESGKAAIAKTGDTYLADASWISVRGLDIDDYEIHAY
jgi:hypothetical protein